MATESTFYDRNWTVLQKIKYLEQWFDTNALDLTTIEFEETYNEEETVMTISITGTTYDGTNITLPDISVPVIRGEQGEQGAAGKSAAVGFYNGSIIPNTAGYYGYATYSTYITWTTDEPDIGENFIIQWIVPSSSTVDTTYLVVGYRTDTYHGTSGDYLYIDGASIITGPTGARGATGTTGQAGLSIYGVADEITTSGASILLTAFTVPSGYSVKVGDLCLGTDGIVGQVQSLTSTTATVRYVLTLQGGGTTGNYVTVDTEQTVTGYKHFEQGVYYNYEYTLEDSNTGYLLLGTIVPEIVGCSFKISINNRIYVCYCSTDYISGYCIRGANSDLLFAYTDSGDFNIYMAFAKFTAPYIIKISDIAGATFEPDFNTISSSLSGTSGLYRYSATNMSVDALNNLSASNYQQVADTPLANSYTYTYYFKLGASSNGCVFTFSLNYGSDESGVMTNTGTVCRITVDMLENLGYSEYNDEDDYGYYPANGVFYNSTTGVSYQIIGVCVNSDRDFAFIYVMPDSVNKVGSYAIYSYSDEEMNLATANCRVIVRNNKGSTTPTITKLNFIS